MYLKIPKNHEIYNNNYVYFIFFIFLSNLKFLDNIGMCECNLLFSIWNEFLNLK